MSERGETSEDPRRGKASELSDILDAKSLTDEEIAARRPKVPELRLRPDASVVVDDNTAAQDLLQRLSTEGARSMQLRHGEREGNVEAVLVPVERYVQLVGLSLVSTNEFEVLSDGKIVPMGMAQADVETADPHATWAEQYFGSGPQPAYEPPPAANESPQEEGPG